MRIMFTCGGTGGHIYPAIALYREFRRCDANGDNEYLFVGSRKGLESELFVEEDIGQYELLRSSGIIRSVSFASLKSAFSNLIALRNARKVFKNFTPDIVIGTGAYPAFHMTYLAYKLGIPYFLVEGNSSPGLVTKLFYRKAMSVFASSAELKSRLGDSENVKLTGIPSRVSRQDTTREQIIDSLGLDTTKKTVTIVGGSCGSEYINSAVLDMLDRYEFDCQFIWSTGKKFSADCRYTKNVKVFKYINNMPEILLATDLIISRSGAMTIQEIKGNKLPAILVPFADAAGNHQYYNAMELAELGVAMIIEEKEIDAEILKSAILEILSDEMRLRNMTYIYSAATYKNSNERVYREIMRDVR